MTKDDLEGFIYQIGEAKTDSERRMVWSSFFKYHATRGLGFICIDQDDRTVNFAIQSPDGKIYFDDDCEGHEIYEGLMDLFYKAKKKEKKAKKK
ncbi:MAG: hypothetical protein IJV02_01385, partial [Candidatus Methanomethylophilaceae archaeon]|nr:hypothetical protein [Candidatus Methanomethylophilaceae archaeon]